MFLILTLAHGEVIMTQPSYKCNHSLNYSHYQQWILLVAFHLYTADTMSRVTDQLFVELQRLIDQLSTIKLIAN